MSRNLQKTIQSTIHIQGKGLHNGIRANLYLKPAEVNSGIVFKRIDVDENINLIEASYKNVYSPVLCTRIKNSNGVSVSTIEHLMAALFIKGVDNAFIEVDGDEIPILDGSSLNFIEEINKAGLKSSDMPIKIVKIENEISIHEDEKFIKIEPNKISLDIDFEIIAVNASIILSLK